MAAALALLLAAAGCNIVGPVAVLAHGPPKVPKAFELDRDRTMVVFIDDRANRLPRRALRWQLAERTERVLLDQRLARDLISARSALALAATESAEAPMSIVRLGRELGAEVVIYATVDRFALSADGITYQPIAVMRVKVLDVVDGRRLWPERDEGHTLTVHVPPRGNPLPQTLADRRDAEAELAELAGEALAQLFYDHPRKDSLLN